MLNFVARTAVGCALLIAGGCASQQKIDPSEARSAVYKSSFQSLFQEVALEVKQQYPNLAARPNERMVKTAWHQLPLTETVEAQEDTLRYDGAHESSSGGNGNFDERRNFRRRNTTRETKHFVRFDVTIAEAGAPGARQWKVVVTGQASVHDGTGIPVELKGAERPSGSMAASPSSRSRFTSASSACRWRPGKSRIPGRPKNDKRRGDRRLLRRAGSTREGYESS